jgi:hypothetical protein
MFPCAGKTNDQVNDCRSDARIGRLGVLVCVHAAAPDGWQGPGNAKWPPGRKPAARNRETYLQTVPAPSAKTAGTSHGRTSTHARNCTDEWSDRPSNPAKTSAHAGPGCMLPRTLGSRAGADAGWRSRPGGCCAGSEPAASSRACCAAPDAVLRPSGQHRGAAVGRDVLAENGAAEQRPGPASPRWRGSPSGPGRRRRGGTRARARLDALLDGDPPVPAPELARAVDGFTSLRLPLTAARSRRRAAAALGRLGERAKAVVLLRAGQQTALRLSAGYLATGSTARWPASASVRAGRAAAPSDRPVCPTGSSR